MAASGQAQISDATSMVDDRGRAFSVDPTTDNTAPTEAVTRYNVKANLPTVAFSKATESGTLIQTYGTTIAELNALDTPGNGIISRLAAMHVYFTIESISVILSQISPFATASGSLGMVTTSSPSVSMGTDKAANLAIASSAYNFQEISVKETHRIKIKFPMNKVLGTMWRLCSSTNGLLTHSVGRAFLMVYGSPAVGDETKFSHQVQFEIAFSERISVPTAGLMRTNMSVFQITDIEIVGSDGDPDSDGGVNLMVTCDTTLEDMAGQVIFPRALTVDYYMVEEKETENEGMRATTTVKQRYSNNIGAAIVTIISGKALIAFEATVGRYSKISWPTDVELLDDPESGIGYVVREGTALPAIPVDESPMTMAQISQFLAASDMTPEEIAVRLRR